MDEREWNLKGLVFMVGVVIASAAGYLGYRWYALQGMKTTVHETSKVLCATIATKVVMTLKANVDEMVSMGMNMTKGSHEVVTTEVDEEITKRFAKRNFKTLPIGSDRTDAKTLLGIYGEIEKRLPEAVRLCDALGDGMEKCLPPYPYPQGPATPECRDANIKPAIEKITAYFRRNFELVK